MLRGLTAVSTAALVPLGQAIALNQVDRQVEIQVTPVSEHTLRLSLVPTVGDAAKSIPSDGSLVKESWGTPVRASGH